VAGFVLQETPGMDRQASGPSWLPLASVISGLMT